MGAIEGLRVLMQLLGLDEKMTLAAARFCHAIGAESVEDLAHAYFAEQLGKELGLSEVKAVKLNQQIKAKAKAEANIDDAGTDDLIKQLTEAASGLGLIVERSGGKTKYEADKIVLGIPKIAASRIATFVNYNGALQQLQKESKRRSWRMAQSPTSSA